MKRILAAAMMLALAGQIGAGPVWAGKHHAKRAFRHHKGRSGRSILLANTTPEPPTPRPSPHYNPDMHGAVPEPSSTPRSQWERDFQEKVKRGLEKPRRMPPHEPNGGKRGQNSAHPPRPTHTHSPTPQATGMTTVTGSPTKGPGSRPNLSNKNKGLGYRPNLNHH